MSRPIEEPVQGEGRSGQLNIAALRVHYLHVQSGRSRRAGCLVCTAGLESVMEATTPFGYEPPVVESDGGDKETDPAPSPDDWAN